jgi:pheromone shutdown protein TraB
MHTQTKVVILGTSHISPQSVKRMRDVFKKEKPEILCLELDRGRFEALLKRKSLGFRQAVKVLGIRAGLVAWLLGYIQRTLGRRTGIMPGKEMMVAAAEAQRYRIPIAFVDQEAIVTMRRMSEIPLKEKLSLFFGFTGGVSFDLKRVPSSKMVERMVKQLKKKTPNIYRVLIEERDSQMAHNIMHLIQERNPKRVLAIVGAGHKRGLANLLRRDGIKKIKTL